MKALYHPCMWSNVSSSQHHFSHCDSICFNADMDDLAWPKARYTHRVVSMAVRLVNEDGFRGMRYVPDVHPCRR